MTSHALPVTGSLRTRIIILLAVAASVTALSAGLLFYGLSSSQQLIDRSQAAQERIEGYITLASRLSDYRSATQAMLATGNLDDEGKLRLRQQVDPVRNAFSSLLSLNVAEVDRASGDGKSLAATKGLVLSRMKAQFDNLHRTMLGLGPDPGALQRGDGALNAFGVAMSPMLVQAIDSERQLIAVTNRQVAQLRTQLIRIAVAVAALALLAFIATWFLVGRPLLRRIDETISGAEAIAGGDLTRRLTPSGNDELTQLMNRFNLMADNLAGREADLRAAQADLQATVDRQTGDLRQVNARLETIDANRRKFFADISHELRTPLTVVQGEAEFNLKPGTRPGAAGMRKSFETILVRVRELRRRVDDMLRVARSESGKLDLQDTLVDINLVAGEAVAGEVATARRRNITLHRAPAPEPLLVQGDRDWLRQVISGLIINAVKYSGEGTRINVVAQAATGNAVVEVVDQGPGIAARDMERVFDRFVQGSSTAGSDGFGIGLHLARWVIEEHGGQISLANNEPGQGLAVTIRLPLAQQHHDGEQKS